LNVKPLADIRREIDALDESLQSLLTKRASLAQAVADAKRAQAPDCTDFYRPEREAEVLRKVCDRNQGPLSNETLVFLFQELMSACLALQKPLQIAFLGPLGTFSQVASQKHFGHSSEGVPVSTIEDVFRQVESGRCDYGMVPVENSTEGMVSQSLDCFLTSQLMICGEVELRIRHHLMGSGELDKKDLSGVERVLAHQQTLAQCRKWLDQNLPSAERISLSSNAEAARQVRDDPQAVAIAAETAATEYGLDLLHCNIEDSHDNTTRFLVVGKQSPGASGQDKTSLLVSTANQPGALQTLLEPLARYQLSMTRIESRPSRRGMWDYVFFIDIKGHQDDPDVSVALQELEERSAMLKVLGAYPVSIAV
jgi:chorismate mutase / prephenate dehydratase